MNGRAQAGPLTWLGILAATGLLLLLVQQTLFLAIPFVLAICLYYILLAPMQRLLRLGWGRNLAALTVGSVFFLGLTLVFGASAAWLSAPVDSWQALFARYVDGGLAFLRRSVIALEDAFPLLQQLQLRSLVGKGLTRQVNAFVRNHLGEILVSVAGWLPSLLLAPFLTFFFLRDGRRFKTFLARAVPNAFFEKTLYLLHEVDQTARRYFEGMAKLTVLDTATLAFGLWVVGAPSPLLLGFIAALLAWVPYVGSIAGCILVVVVASTDMPNDAMMAYSSVGVFILARLLDDFVYMPMTLGRSLRMHPLVTVLMIFVGGALAGVAGLMLVLPVLGVAMVVGETATRIVTDPRLQARHRHAQALRRKQASLDLNL
ncbi:AI-2E family transporter [Massilia sp. TS11]|uniref:AI-2E family transporter n=1 Tax=Massilia sp. TS11 TaxID=2908003 RepID=UPI001EDB3DEB|nr:AI-2E family transporter [Massilia sp. TS11]MCG2585074.1 AI-2E family transporter [Massilia sp. TS11]